MQDFEARQAFAHTHLEVCVREKLTRTRLGQEAMNRRRRTTTTIEQHEVLVMRSSRRLIRVFCPECSDRVVLVTLDEAVKLSGASSRTIHQQIEEKRIHFVETADGLVLICPASILRQSAKQKGLLGALGR